MHKSKFFFALVFFAVLSSGCSTKLHTNGDEATAKDTTTSMTTDDMTMLLKEKVSQAIGGEYSSVPNATGSHMLCVSTEKDMMTPFERTFLVHDQEGDIVVMPRKIRGSVQWMDDQSIAIDHVMGTEREGDPTSSTKREVITVVKHKR